MSGNDGRLRINPHPSSLRDMQRQMRKLVNANGAIAAAEELATQGGTAGALATPATTSTPGVVKMAGAVADLGLTVSNPPTDVEVQQVADKVDALLASLRSAGILHT